MEGHQNAGEATAQEQSEGGFVDGEPAGAYGGTDESAGGGIAQGTSEAAPVEHVGDGATVTEGGGDAAEGDGGADQTGEGDGQGEGTGQTGGGDGSGTASNTGADSTTDAGSTQP